jgi:hypothetical protein
VNRGTSFETGRVVKALRRTVSGEKGAVVTMGADKTRETDPGKDGD